MRFPLVGFCEDPEVKKYTPLLGSKPNEASKIYFHVL